VQIETVLIDDLDLDPRNARKHDEKNLKAIVDSLELFGQRKPIVVWGRTVVAGNGTMVAARSLGWSEISIARVPDDWSSDQVKAYALADNRSAELAEWDEQVLASQLLELQEAEFDVELLGFEIPVEPLQDVVEDDIPEQVEPKSKLGDVWKLGRHRLMCGDSTDNATVQKLMDGNKADLVFTDPPYGINVVKDNKVGADFGVAKKGNYSAVISDDTTDTAKASFQILQGISTRQILWGGNYFVDFLPFSDGWLVWDKRGDTGIRNTFADGEMAWCSFHTPIRIYKQLWNGMIREGERDKRVHPTQKPLQTLSAILNDFSKPDEIIVDVFGGSGSTLIACEQTDRTCYMMELDPKYVDVIIARWEKLTGQTAELIEG
jgi:site-specific DNA-methyltransferase (adenine-specific)